MLCLFIDSILLQCHHMKRKGPDPALFVILGLVAIMLILIATAFAGRSCAKGVKDLLSIPGYSDNGLGNNARPLAQKDFDAFVKQAEAVDLGIGVHLGMSVDELTAALGKPDLIKSSGDGKQVYSFDFPANLESPAPADRRSSIGRSGNSPATLRLTISGGKVAKVSLKLPYCSSTSEYSLIKLNAKPFSECRFSDAKALFGTPQVETEHDATWEYYPATEAALKTVKEELPETPPADAKILEPQDYDGFVKKVQAFDFGINVHLGQTWEELQSAFGDSGFSSLNNGRIRQCHYMLSPKGLKEEYSPFGGSPAMLTVALKDDIVRDINLHITPIGKKNGFKYLVVNGKPLLQCQIGDLIQVLGEQSSDYIAFGDCSITWLYAAKPSGNVPWRFTQVDISRMGRDDSFGYFHIADISPSQLEGVYLDSDSSAATAPKPDRSIYISFGTEYYEDGLLHSMEIDLRDLSQKSDSDSGLTPPKL